MTRFYQLNIRPPSIGIRCAVVVKLWASPFL